MIIQISVAVMAAALCILVLALVRTLKELRETLDRIGHMTDETTRQLSTLSQEVRGTIHSVNEMTQDVRMKMREMHSLFETVGEVGRMMNDVTVTVKQTASGLASSIKDKMEEKAAQAEIKLSQAAGWLAAVIRTAVPQNRLKSKASGASRSC